MKIEERIANHFFKWPAKLKRKTREQVRFFRNTQIGWFGEGIRLFKSSDSGGLEPANKIEDAEVVVYLRHFSPYIVFIIDAD